MKRLTLVVIFLAIILGYVCPAGVALGADALVGSQCEIDG